MATNYGKTCENENYGGMCRIYVDLYRDLLWAVFINEVPIPVLVSELKKFLKNARTFKPLHQQFNRLLKVHASTGTIKNTDCDISVIYSLFRNIPNTLVTPTRGWGKVPPPGDVLVTDDVERIRHGRNELIGHSVEASITDADFTTQFSDIKDIVTRLERHVGSSYLPHLLQIESDCQSSKGHLNHYDEYINELKRQKDVEADLRDLVNEKLGAHDAKLEELDTKLGGHDTKFDKQDTKFDEQDTKFDEQDTKFDEQDTKFDEQDTKFTAHATKFEEQDTKFTAQDTKFDEQDTKFTAHDTKFEEQDTTFDIQHTKFTAHDTKFDELYTKFTAHDTKFDEQDTKFTAHDTKFDEQYTKFGSKLEEHDTKYRDLETKMEGQEQIYSRVQRRQEEERREKQERTTKLAAELKHYLVNEKYKGEILQGKPSQWFKMKDVLQMFVPLQIREDLERWMALSSTERKKEMPSQASEVKEIKSNSMHEIFFKGSDRQYKIFLLGEAGVGKSTLCHQLVDKWCRVQDSAPQNDYESELKLFEFLFFIQARFSDKSQTVYKMIKEQLCPLQYHKVLKKLFTSHPESCLVLIDGLDEWQSSTRGYQELPNATDIFGCTILITSRQWRVETLDCDLGPSCRVLEIRGLDSDGIENLAVKVFEAFTREDNPSADCQPLVNQFMDQINLLKLNRFAQIPFLLIILIKSWLNGNKNLPNARGFIYAGLIESMLVHSGKNVKHTGTWGDRTHTQALPSCFNKKEHCLRYSSLIHELSRLAFTTLFSDEKKNALVITRQELAHQLGIKEQLTPCLQLGLLTESKGLSETKECQQSFSFPHTIIQEFFSALYLSGEGFETGYARFCERVTSPVEVFDFANVVLFLSGMNLTHCKTLFDYICNIVFARQFADDLLYPADWYMRDKIVKIQNLALLCTDEAMHSVPKGSHTGESMFVIPDMVVHSDTPEYKVLQFCSLGLNIKSLVYECCLSITVTPYYVLKSIKTMQHIQRLGIGCKTENTKKYIVCICTYLSNLHELKSFSFSVVDSIVKLSKSVSTELASKLGTLPNLVSVCFQGLDLSDINKCQFTSQLTSLGLWNTNSLSPLVSSWCNQLHTLYMWDVDLSPAAVCQYVMTSSSLQSLTLILADRFFPSPLYTSPTLYAQLPLSTVFYDVLDLTSHTSLHTLHLGYIHLQSGVRIHPGHNLRKIIMSSVSMAESMWQEFIHNLPAEPLQQLDVTLAVKSLNTQLMSYIRDKFCVTEDRADRDSGRIRFNTKNCATA